MPLNASSLSPEQEQQLRTLLRFFLEENAKLNLSAYRTGEQCWVGNVLDSVAAVDVVRTTCSSFKASGWGRICRVIDIGTGGGFPLLPLALLLPEIEFTGLDATKKKIDAVKRQAEKLELQNVRLLAGRAEEVGHPAPPRPFPRRGGGYRASDPELREQFDIVLCRAVAELPTLLEYCSPFVRVGGRVIAWKTLSIEEELQASVTARMQLHCRLMERHEYELPDGWGRRQLLLFEKVKTLPREFPRRVGVPKKQPL